MKKNNRKQQKEKKAREAMRKNKEEKRTVTKLKHITILSGDEVVYDLNDDKMFDSGCMEILQTWNLNNDFKLSVANYNFEIKNVKYDESKTDKPFCFSLYIDDCLVSKNGLLKPLSGEMPILETEVCTNVNLMVRFNLSDLPSVLTNAAIMERHIGKRIIQSM